MTALLLLTLLAGPANTANTLRAPGYHVAPLGSPGTVAVAAGGDGGASQERQLAVGSEERIKMGPTLAWSCDDPAVVSVDRDAKTGELVVKGRKAGVTKCAFTNPGYTRLVYTFHVVDK